MKRTDQTHHTYTYMHTHTHPEEVWLKPVPCYNTPHDTAKETPVTSESLFKDMLFSKIFIHIAHKHIYAFETNYKKLVRTV